jgi:hypothetical protein
MNDREDRKLREVAVGRYGYRHEAEFAAGFLEDAGIPYRLQVDDPAMGMTLSASAIVWVHAMDEERARDLLEHHDDDLAEFDGDAVDEEGHSWEGLPRDEGEGRSENLEDDGADDLSKDSEERRKAGRRSAVEPTPMSSGSAVPRFRSPAAEAPSERQAMLATRPRLLALFLGVALLTVAALGLLPGTLLSATVGAAGAGLTLVAALGRAPGPLHRALSSLSGEFT